MSRALSLWGALLWKAQQPCSVWPVEGPWCGPSLSCLCGPVATMDHICGASSYVGTEISIPRLCPDPWCVQAHRPPLISFLGPLLTLFWGPEQTDLSTWQLLHIYNRPCMCPSSGSTELLALSSKGRLITCSLDLNSKAPVPAKMSVANAGQKIKELLVDIGDVSER